MSVKKGYAFCVRTAVFFDGVLIFLQVAGPVKSSPPFRGEEIEIVLPVEPCELYDFELRIINPQNKEIGKIKDLELKALADVDSYIPPPLTSVVLVDYTMGGKYNIKTQPTSPVPATCLPDYMEALDAYANRLETVANEQSGKNRKDRKIQFVAQKDVEITQADLLVRQGCVCASPRLVLKSSSPLASQGVSPQALGVYLYEGVHGGRPYYKLDLEGRSTGEFIALRPADKPKTRAKRFIGRVDGGGTTTTRRPWNYGAGGGGSSSWSSSSWSSWSSSSSLPGKSRKQRIIYDTLVQGVAKLLIRWSNNHYRLANCNISLMALYQQRLGKKRIKE